MYHVIALYNNTYYYMGCAWNHEACLGMLDVYKRQFPKVEVWHCRYHPFAAMLEYVKDFNNYHQFEAAYNA